jgi:hypothetical protein
LVAVFNQTLPLPPPGAGVVLAALAVVEADDFAGVAGAAGAELDGVLAAGVEAELLVLDGVLAAGVAAELLVLVSAGAPYQSFTPLCPRHAPCLVAP